MKGKKKVNRRRPNRPDGSSSDGSSSGTIRSTLFNRSRSRSTGGRAATATSSRAAKGPPGRPPEKSSSGQMTKPQDSPGKKRRKRKKDLENKIKSGSDSEPLTVKRTAATKVCRGSTNECGIVAQL